MPILCYKRVLKKLRQILKNKANDIWFEDECHFQQHGTRCRMWVPPEEKDPIVRHAPTRKSIALFGAVSAERGEMVSMDAKIFNAETFLLFLNKVVISKKRGKKIILILDNARYHHATMIQPWLNKNNKKIQLLFLPPYSPDLNNIERVWKLTRRICTHNKYFATIDELLNVVKRLMKIWTRPNELLRKLCCII
jgi:transposase